MIQTKDDLKDHLEQDRIANHKEPITTFCRRIVNWIFLIIIINISVAGNPAVKVSDNESFHYLNKN